MNILIMILIIILVAIALVNAGLLLGWFLFKGVMLKYIIYRMSYISPASDEYKMLDHLYWQVWFNRLDVKSKG